MPAFRQREPDQNRISPPPADAPDRRETTQAIAVLLVVPVSGFFKTAEEALRFVIHEHAREALLVRLHKKGLAPVPSDSDG